MLKFLRIFLALIVSCAGQEVIAADPTPAAGPSIGILLPLSGNFAALGTDSRQGIEIAEEELKLRTVLTLIFDDSKADPATAVGEFRKLVDTDKVLAVYALRSPVGMALNPLSHSSGVSLLGGVGNKDFATQNDFAFQIWSRSDEEGVFLAETLLTRGIKNIALITAQDDWTDSVSGGFRAEYAKRGGTIVLDQSVPPGDLEFSTIVSQTIAKKPDALFVNLTLAQIAPFLRRAREQNNTLPIYSNFFASKKEVVEAAGSAVEGVKFVEMDTNLPTFRKRLQERFGTNASGATLAGYVATILLGQAAAQTSTPQTPAAFYAALLKQSEIHTPDVVFRIENRKVKFPLVLRKIHDGKAEAAEAR